MKKIVVAKCFAGATASLLVGMSLATCSNTPTDAVGGGSQTGGGGSGIKLNFDAGPSSGGGGSGSTGPAPTADANCGAATYGTTQAPADVLLLLDRSASMTESIAEDCCCSNTCAGGTKQCSNTSNCTERWPAVTSAVETAISQTTQINWGLKFFSTPQTGRQNNNCAVSNGVEVGVAAASGSAIQTAITGTSPGGYTPTASAITASAAYLKTLKDPNNKVILLATDGEPNCGANSSDVAADDTPATVTAIGDALTAGFKTYVIGIGPASSITNLDKFASAGGTDHYYPATSPADLASALAAISTAVASCTFTVSQAPTNANSIGIYLDGNLLNQDSANGWSYGGNNQTIVLNGSACASITSGTATKVQVYFGCGGPPPPIL